MIQILWYIIHIIFIFIKPFGDPCMLYESEFIIFLQLLIQLCPIICYLFVCVLHRLHMSKGFGQFNQS